MTFFQQDLVKIVHIKIIYLLPGGLVHTEIHESLNEVGKLPRYRPNFTF